MIYIRINSILILFLNPYAIQESISKRTHKILSVITITRLFAITNFKFSSGKIRITFIYPFQSCPSLKLIQPTSSPLRYKSIRSIKNLIQTKTKKTLNSTHNAILFTVINFIKNSIQTLFF